MVIGSELWTPPGVEYVSGNRFATNNETGDAIVNHTFRFKDKASGRGMKVVVPADRTVSQAHIEDMAAKACENWMEDLRAKKKKRAPTPKERKEIGSAINEWRQYMLKRKMSTNSKLYY